jgi:amidase
VGFDARDPFTAVAATAARTPYRAEPAPSLDMRVGVLESGFGSDDEARSASVNTVVRSAISELQSLGATLVPGLEIADLAEAIAETSVYVRQSKADLTAFLAERDGPVHSYREIYERNAFHPENDLFHGIMSGSDDPDSDPENLRLRLNQQHFQRRVLTMFAESGLDVLVYPSVQVVPPTHEELAAGLYTALTFPTNTVIASQAGLPAISVPVGFTPDGLPVGLEVLGTPFSENALLRFAATWEAAMQPRKAPAVAHA